MGRAMRWGTNNRFGLLQSKKGFGEWQNRSGGLRGDGWSIWSRTVQIDDVWALGIRFWSYWSPKVT